MTKSVGGAQRVVLENPAHARTDAPLAVLVNHRSASASEILAGALRDNGRLVALVGETTYGKGKIQSVFELDDGSALFVTVAKCAARMLPIRFLMWCRRKHFVPCRFF